MNFFQKLFGRKAKPEPKPAPDIPHRPVFISQPRNVPPPPRFQPSAPASFSHSRDHYPSDPGPSLTDMVILNAVIQNNQSTSHCAPAEPSYSPASSSSSWDSGSSSSSCDSGSSGSFD